MRQGKVYYKDHLAGIVTETNEGEYVFQYDDQYVKDYPNDFITFYYKNKFQFTIEFLSRYSRGVCPVNFLKNRLK